MKSHHDKIDITFKTVIHNITVYMRFLSKNGLSFELQSMFSLEFELSEGLAGSG